MSFTKIICAIGSMVHWITGFLVHPHKGGCCETTPDKIVTDLKKDE